MPTLANGKIRLIVTAKCNLDCFYCHNEGQAKRRRGDRRCGPA